MQSIGQFRKPGLILVEGKDDDCIVQSLLQHLGLSDQIDTLQLGGKDDWPRKLRAVARLRGFGLVKSLLLVRDSDSNPGGAFQAIRGALTSAKLPVPDEPTEWAVSPKMRAAGHLLPSETANGELEDLCLLSVSNEPAMHCVELMANCVAQLADPPSKLAKFKVQAYLAAQPGVFDTLAIGAKAGVFPPGHAAFSVLRALLTEMA